MEIGDREVTAEHHGMVTIGLLEYLRTSLLKRVNGVNSSILPLQRMGSTLCLRGHRNALSKDKVDKRKLQFSSFEQP